jgi:acyl-CoA reductase-like NAD-dependent aldehyde dehydrogenase
MQIVNPSTGEAIDEVSDDTQASTAEKFARARKAQTSWARLPFAERRAKLARFVELMGAEQPSLAQTLTSEVGKPLTQSHNELSAFQDRIRYFLDHTEACLNSETVLQDTGIQETISHEPLGVIGNISAWNYPYFVGGNVFLPALLTGNSVLYKPSEYATLTGLSIARLLHAAGVPKDCFATVIGAGAVGASLLEQPLDGVFFTGSVATGLKVAAQAAEKLIPVGLELGGKDPAYAASDVDPTQAAVAIADGAFYNAGQSCCAVERVYVHRSIWNEFLAAFKNAAKQLVVGDPFATNTTLGPLARREAALAHLEEQLNDARSRGARIVCGGSRIARAGYFFEPTVVVDVDHTMKLMTEETFGPLIGLMPVADDAEALQLMDDTEYGLTAAVYTRSQERAERLLSALHVGSAYWNCCDRVSPRLPWSGRRHSGLGATLSTQGIKAFTQPKAWHKRLP